MEQQQKHLPLWGAGPLYVIVISILTAVAVFINFTYVPVCPLDDKWLLPVQIIALLVIIAGAWLWIDAVLISQLQKNIKANNLVTTGAYAWVRHPVYSAFMLIEWGILLILGDLAFYLLIPVYWIFLSLLMKYTEEKWLHHYYGDAYARYCKRVNRCIPWFPKKGR